MRNNIAICPYSRRRLAFTLAFTYEVALIAPILNESLAWA
jgi:hypothetical protein